MKAGPIHRAVGDIFSVCQCARPAAAARWVTALMFHMPECTRSRSLRPADRIWARAGARFRTSTGVVVSLPPAFTHGAREMYCRDVYLRTGLTMPTMGWVVDLGANRGLFSVWAALAGAQVVAVEAQKGFAAEIGDLAEHNGVAERIHVEIAVASGATASGAKVGDIADDDVWSATSHGTSVRPADVSVPVLMSTYGIDRIGLLKMDIEGGEFAVLAADEDLSWLTQVDQLTLEVHSARGDAVALIRRLRHHAFVIDLRDNNGRRVDISSNNIEYAYCHRP
jgi:FkbM family methyltransferase